MRVWTAFIYLFITFLLAMSEFLLKVPSVTNSCSFHGYTCSDDRIHSAYVMAPVFNHLLSLLNGFTIFPFPSISTGRDSRYYGRNG